MKNGKNLENKITIFTKTIKQTGSKKGRKICKKKIFTSTKKKNYFVQCGMRKLDKKKNSRLKLKL